MLPGQQWPYRKAEEMHMLMSTLCTNRTGTDMPGHRTGMITISSTAFVRMFCGMYLLQWLLNLTTLYFFTLLNMSVVTILIVLRNWSYLYLELLSRSQTLPFWLLCTAPAFLKGRVLNCFVPRIWCCIWDRTRDNMLTVFLIKRIDLRQIWNRSIQLLINSR